MLTVLFSPALDFSTEESKVALVLTLLSGQAALWGTAVWENKHPCCSSFHTLSEEMRQVFDRAVAGREAAHMLADLRQENRPVSDYSIEFRTLAAECKAKLTLHDFTHRQIAVMFGLHDLIVCLLVVVVFTLHDYVNDPQPGVTHYTSWQQFCHPATGFGP